MASGRTQEVAARNAEMKRRYNDLAWTPAELAEHYGISRQQVHIIIADPHSHEVTARKPKVIVRPLETNLGPEYDGVVHGSDQGYREERRRGLETCGDCREAHAMTVAATSGGYSTRPLTSR